LASDNERIRVRQTKSVRGVRGKNMDARTRVGVYEFKLRKSEGPAKVMEGRKKEWLRISNEQNSNRVD
jgi:hypothetical protein